MKANETISALGALAHQTRLEAFRLLVQRGPDGLPAGVIADRLKVAPSTSFANPAVTIARSLTNTFAGIAPAHAPGFITAEFAGGAVAVVLFAWLLPPRSNG